MLYLPIGLALVAGGNVRGGVIVLGVGFLLVSQVDNVLKPFLILGRASLHPMAVFFAILAAPCSSDPLESWPAPCC